MRNACSIGRVSQFKRGRQLRVHGFHLSTCRIPARLCRTQAGVRMLLRSAPDGTQAILINSLYRAWAGRNWHAGRCRLQRAPCFHCRRRIVHVCSCPASDDGVYRIPAANPHGKGASHNFKMAVAPKVAPDFSAFTARREVYAGRVVFDNAYLSMHHLHNKLHL